MKKNHEIPQLKEQKIEFEKNQEQSVDLNMSKRISDIFAV